jgi:FkbM family methyltransferase
MFRRLLSGWFGAGLRPAASTNRAKTMALASLLAGGANDIYELRGCRCGPMLYNKNDKFIGRSLAAYGEYSYGEVEAFSRYVTPGSCVVEAGANIGSHTIDLSHIVGDDGAVFAFEPQRLVFQNLCANVALNQCTNVFTFHAALGAKRGEVHVPDLDPRTEQNFGGVTLVGATGGYTTPVYALDDYNLSRCDLLKVDVEGMEIDVLAGAEKTIERTRPLLYVENNPGAHSRELVAMILAKGYDIYWHVTPIFSPDNFFGNKNDIFPGVGSINIFCVPRERGLVVDGQPLRSPDEAMWKFEPN